MTSTKKRMTIVEIDKPDWMMITELDGETIAGEVEIDDNYFLPVDGFTLDIKLNKAIPCNEVYEFYLNWGYD